MKRFLFAALLLVSCSGVHAAQSIKAQVNGMVCAFCAQGIERKLKALAQTHAVYVNLPQRIVALELKGGQSITDEAFSALVKDAGYDVVRIERVSQTAAEIKAEARKK